MLRPMARPAGHMQTGAAGGGVPEELGGMDPTTLAQILGSLSMPENERMPLPQTTFPEAPRAMNPAFTQLLMQALQSAGGSPSNSGTLGQLLGGR